MFLTILLSICVLDARSYIYKFYLNGIVLDLLQSHHDVYPMYSGSRMRQARSLSGENVHYRRLHDIAKIVSGRIQNSRYYSASCYQRHRGLWKYCTGKIEIRICRWQAIISNQYNVFLVAGFILIFCTIIV